PLGVASGKRPVADSARPENSAAWVTSNSLIWLFINILSVTEVLRLPHSLPGRGPSLALVARPALHDGDHPAKECASSRPSAASVFHREDFMFKFQAKSLAT